MPARERTHAYGAAPPPAEGSDPVRVVRTGEPRGARADGARGRAPLLPDRSPGLLVRRGQLGSPDPPVAGQDARTDPADRVDAAAVLLPRLGLGPDLRLRRGRAAIAVGPRRNARRARLLRDRREADLATRRADRGRAHSLQPVSRLVLAGGPLVRAARAPERALAARIRIRPRGADATRARGVGDRLGARPGDALLR